MVSDIEKKLTTLAKRKVGAEVKPWIASIKNHLYWIAATSGDNGPLKRAKWLSILNHITNKHSGHGGVFPQCEHGVMDERCWLRKGIFIENCRNNKREEIQCNLS